MSKLNGVELSVKDRVIFDRAARSLEGFFDGDRDKVISIFSMIELQGKEGFLENCNNINKTHSFEKNPVDQDKLASIVKEGLFDHSPEAQDTNVFKTKISEYRMELEEGRFPKPDKILGKK
jgi:hypothetical protein